MRIPFRFIPFHSMPFHSIPYADSELNNSDTDFSAVSGVFNSKNTFKDTNHKASVWKQDFILLFHLILFWFLILRFF